MHMQFQGVEGSQEFRSRTNVEHLSEMLRIYPPRNPRGCPNNHIVVGRSGNPWMTTRCVRRTQAHPLVDHRGPPRAQVLGKSSAVHIQSCQGHDLLGLSVENICLPGFAIPSLLDILLWKRGIAVQEYGLESARIVGFKPGPE